MSIRDIQVFIGFANFYWRFIRGFNRIVALLTSLLKIIGLSNLASKTFRANDNELVGGNSDRANKTVMNLFKNNKFRNLTCMPNIGATGEPNLLIFDAKKAFNHLQLAFIEALILQYFDLKSHIQIKIDVSSYAIGKMLSPLNLDSDTSPNNSNSNKSDFS